ncbi:hypothetical protein [Cupriavidus agavae]|uniref:Uncharacterized protein n=1 Tax=Cupriavidus agavae TaxID=1001822 RepID=A0A4V2FEA2_9BURK|nr:hypothetical protein [Cupriavidus agavae]RZT29069.1 hypothetical protein EV147_5030 [Cupriavidus agavae]
METISLFPQGACDPVEMKADKAIAAIVALFAAGHPVVVAYSGGKDSSVVAALALYAALPLGILAVGKIVPAAIMVAHRESVALAAERPVSPSAAVVIALIWAASITLTLWLGLPVFLSRNLMPPPGSRRIGRFVGQSFDMQCNIGTAHARCRSGELLSRWKGAD